MSYHFALLSNALEFETLTVQAGLADSIMTFPLMAVDAIVDGVPTYIEIGQWIVGTKPFWAQITSVSADGHGGTVMSIREAARSRPVPKSIFGKFVYPSLNLGMKTMLQGMTVTPSPTLDAAETWPDITSRIVSKWGIGVQTYVENPAELLVTTGKVVIDTGPGGTVALFDQLPEAFVANGWRGVHNEVATADRWLPPEWVPSFSEIIPGDGVEEHPDTDPTPPDASVSEKSRNYAGAIGGLLVYGSVGYMLA